MALSRKATVGGQSISTNYNARVPLSESPAQHRAPSLTSSLPGVFLASALS